LMIADMEIAQIISSTAGLGFAASVAYFSPWLWRQRYMGQVRRKLADKRILALTYDDGPNDRTTPPLLDLLQRHKARASFFMLGQNARQFPDLVDRVVREGHEVGSHSYRHLNAWKTSPWRAMSDIREGYAQLSPWVHANGMFRPPHGKMTLPTYCAIQRRGATTW